MTTCAICSGKLEHPKRHTFKGKAVCSDCFELASSHRDTEPI